MWVYDAQGNQIGATQTDASGAYRVTGLPAGSYLVEFQHGGYGNRYYDGKTTLATADPVTVSAGHTTGSIDLAMPRQAIVEGTVTGGPAATPLAGVDVAILTADGREVSDTTTDATGNYTVTGLAAATYTAYFQPAAGTNYIGQYLGNQTSQTDATTFTVSDGQVTSQINADLAVGGEITGHVTAVTGGSGLAGVAVSAYGSTGYGAATTDTNGNYTIVGLPTDTYQVDFASVDGKYLTQYYNGKTSFIGADPVAVTAGAATGSIDAVLAAAVQIEGTVTAAGSGNPIQNIAVTVLDASGNYLASGHTQADGTYTVGGLSAGSYRVEFSPGSAANNYVTQYYRDQSSLSAATSIAADDGQVVTGIDASLQPGGAITGTVTDAGTHVGIGLATVNVYDGQGTFVASTTTGSGGTYRVTGLAAGNYRLQFTDTGYASQYYNGQATLASADQVSVTAGATGSGIDAALHQGSSISGTVTDTSTGQPVASAVVEILDQHGAFVRLAFTDSQGNYSVGGLASGSYEVEFNDYGVYVAQYYNASSTLQGAAAVDISDGQAVTGIDAALDPGARITGRVTDATTGKPISGLQVYLANPQGQGVASGATGADGTYTIAGVTPGPYVVGFGRTGVSPNYVPQYYDGQSGLGSARVVTATDGQTTSGIDAAMQPGAELEGTVTDVSTGSPLASALVTVYDTGGNYVAGASTGPDGSYTVASLSSGSYRLQFTAGGHIAQYYNNQPTLASADAIALSAAQVKTGISAALQNGGGISGTVTDSGSQAAVPGASVYAYDSSGAYAGSGVTGSDGSYTISGLPTGPYRVEFSDSGYAPQFYNHQTSLGTADPVAVTAGSNTAGIDGHLGAGGAITGTVTDATTGAPASGVTVALYTNTASSTLVASTTTNASGRYTLAGLSTGTYNVWFSSSSYLRSYYNHDPVSVTYGQTTSSVDQALTPSATISGAITDAATHAGVSGALVSAYNTSGSVVASVFTDLTGRYTLSNLPTGAYRVGFTDYNSSQNYLPQYYDGKATLATADPITLATGANRSGVDGALTPGAQIQGTVTDASTGNPVQGAFVKALGSDGTALSTATSDAQGHYSLGGLAAGTYYLSVYPTSTSLNYLAQYYNGKSTLATATPVTVTDSQTLTGIDVRLQPAGQITGTVTSSKDGKPLVGMTVAVFSANSQYPLQTTTTTADGRYALNQLTTGSYYVSFHDPAGLHRDQLYDDAADRANATAVSVTTGQPTSGIDATLTAAGRITGSVLDAENIGPISGANVTLYDANGASVASTTSDSGGNYSFGPLAAGQYSVAFDNGTSGGDYGTAYYNGRSSLVTADPVTVTDEVTTSGVNGKLTSLPVNTTLPTVSGTPQQDHLLTEAQGTWTHHPTSYTYQWQRCDITGANCTSIAGATAQTYTATGADVGYRLEVIEIATNAGGAGQPATSALTDVVLPAPPVNQSAPTISGSAVQGRTLSEQHGAWTNNPGSYDLQWMRCDSAGGNCSVISGATAQTYVPVAADVGQTLLVSESATNAGGIATAVSSAITPVVAPPAPTNIAAPTISGVAAEGETLNEANGSWTGSPSRYTYQWLRCDSAGNNCTPVRGATDQSYVLTAADVGYTIDVQEIAFNDGGASDPSAAAPTSPVLTSVPVNFVPPAISGHAQDGQPLTETHGAWSNTPTHYSYQWLRCDRTGLNCSLIHGATGQNYVLSSADVGSTVTVAETATNSAGESNPYNATPTPVVLPATPTNTSPPAIVGNTVQGDTLTAAGATWTEAPTGFAFQWLRCDQAGANCTAIPTATAGTYLLTADDVGFTVAASEAATNAGGTSDPAQSPASDVVTAAIPMNTSAPSISGAAVQGQTLTAQHGGWTNQPTGYTYQWLRCDTNGSSCSPIDGATGSSYTLSAPDVGSTVRAQETASNNAGSATTPATSDATETVVPAAPGNVGPPTISGSAQEGQTLTEQHGQWTNSPTSYSYQWLRCTPAGTNCTPIASAQQQTYTPGADDVSHTLEVQETTTNPAGASAPANSTATSQVAGEPPAATQPPTISGTNQVGQTLTEAHGQWTNSPTGYTYQWLRCDNAASNCATIAGATSRTYTPTGDDLGATIEVRETAGNDAGNGNPATSAPTRVITEPPTPVPTHTSSPQISGTAQQGQTLSLTRGTWTGYPTSYSDQWQRCDSNGQNCVPILGAAGVQYSPTDEDVGHTLVVQETASNAGGTSAPGQSNATATIAAAPIHADAGDALAGTTSAPVTLDASASAPANLITSYQWQFGDGAGASGKTVQHTYAHAGTYTARVTASTGAGTDTATTTVKITGPTSTGVQITAQTTDGTPIPSADVAYMAADGTRIADTTGADGAATLNGLPDGTATVYLYAAGYKVAVGKVAVNGGAGSTTVQLVPGQVATAKLTSKPMTLAEIEAAGIDVNDPANQNVYQFDVKLNVAGAPELCGHINSNGTFVGQTGFGCGGGGGGGGGSCWVNSCSTSGFEAVGRVAHGKPFIEWLVLDGQASVLKQFFSVSMVIDNLSPDPVALTDGTATLKLPSGLSLAPTATPQTPTQSMPTIPGMGSTTATWIVRGDEPGDWSLSAAYDGTLQPFSEPFHLDASLQKPLHIWGADALALSVQADTGSLTAGQPYHVRLGITNNADVPFYNVGLALDSSRHDNFIFQPQEQFSDTVGELDPGQTTYSHTYILVPSANSTGSFDPSVSTATFAGQQVSPGSGIAAVTPPALYTLMAPTDTVGEVHLHWQPVPGAQGYEVFSVPDLSTPFGDQPDGVDAVGQNAVTTLPASATDAYIPAEAGSSRYYAVSTLIDGRPTLEHPAIVGTPGVAAPAPGGSGGSGGIGGGAKGSGGSSGGGSTNTGSKLVAPGWGQGGEPLADISNPKILNTQFAKREDAADARYAGIPQECGPNSALLFRVRGSGALYGNGQRAGGKGQDNLGGWADKAGAELIAKGWRVRDLQALYSAPGVPFPQIEQAWANVAKRSWRKLIPGEQQLEVAKALAATVTAIKAFRDAATRQWRQVEAQLTAAAHRCPTAKILIAGYSQGGIVLRYLIPALPKQIRGQIVSVDLLADPTADGTVDGILARSGPADFRQTPQGVDTLAGRIERDGAALMATRFLGPVGGLGVLAAFHFHQTKYPAWIAKQVYQYCLPNDLVCDATLGSFRNYKGEGARHASYHWQTIGGGAARRLRSW